MPQCLSQSMADPRSGQPLAKGEECGGRGRLRHPDVSSFIGYDVADLPRLIGLGATLVIHDVGGLTSGWAWRLPPRPRDGLRCRWPVAQRRVVDAGVNLVLSQAVWWGWVDRRGMSIIWRPSRSLRIVPMHRHLLPLVPDGLIVLRAILEPNQIVILAVPRPVPTALSHVQDAFTAPAWPLRADPR